MRLPEISIKRPVFMTMVGLALIVFGLVAFPKLALDLFPKIDFPVVNITTKLVGASPEIMEVDVTDTIEEAVNTINGVKSITSRSMEEYSIITVEFFLERNLEQSAQDVRDKVAAVRNRLPKDTEPPVIEKISPEDQPIVWIAVWGDRSVKDLTHYADKILKRDIEKIPGVGSVTISGGRTRQIRFWLDRKKLEAVSLTADDVKQALGLEHREVPGGRIENHRIEYIVKTKGEYETPASFNDMVITYRHGRLIRLRDIGRAEDGLEDERSITRFNGKTSVGLSVKRQSGENTVAVAERVKAAVAATRPPQGMKLDITFDQSKFIRRSIEDVQISLWLGAGLAVLIIFVFLRSVRSTLISAVALPTSVIATFAFIQVFGFTLNIMTMLGLSLSIGILIDDSIVVLENIYRRMEEGEPPMQASQEGASEIGLAVMATTLSIVAVFVPVAFMKGIVGKFFFEFGITVTVAVLISLFVSLTLTPMLTSRFLSHTKKHGKVYLFLEKGFDAVFGVYRPLLGWALRNRWKVILMALASVVAGIALFMVLGKEFLPAEDQGRYMVRLETPIDYSLSRADSAMRKIDEQLRLRPEVLSTFYVTGSDLTPDINKSRIYVNLKERKDRSIVQIDSMKQVRDSLTSLPDIKPSVEVIAMVGGGMRSVPIQLMIQGRNLDDITMRTIAIRDAFAKLPGIVDVDTSIETGKPEVRVHIDREKAANFGVSAMSIGNTVNIMIGGEIVGKYKDEKEGERYDIVARLTAPERDQPSALDMLWVRSSTGELVRLKDVTRIETGKGPTIIMHYNRQRAATLFAGTEKTKPMAEAMTDLDKIVKKNISPDISTRYVGMADAMLDAFKNIAFALVIAIIMVYMILASQFESFVHPFTIMFSLPVSLIGAMGLLMVTGERISIYSLIGIIMLMGLVTKNAILLVDYTITLRSRGMGRDDALLKAGPVRLRPIIMTTAAMVFGMLPTALKIGEGAESRAPMAIAVIGGLITSTLLTLVVVPVVYTLIDDLEENFRKNRVTS
ncbi:MAG: efflux RND transporter permease subunit [Nitrospirae bacterium]|nr:efflux RND transporter permease subunit [Nitrospirota bacterium]NTW64939.1 efflux RND transporter permease subunit [Nitrospirota bacterium]